MLKITWLCSGVFGLFFHFFAKNVHAFCVGYNSLAFTAVYLFYTHIGNILYFCTFKH